MKLNLSILTALLFFTVTSCWQDDYLSDPNAEEQSLKSVKLNPGEHVEGVLKSGALYYISLPENWSAQETHTIIFYAHGLQDPGEGPVLPDDTISGRSVEDIITGMGYGYATTSYYDDGFVANEAVDDIILLRKKVLKVVPDLSNDDVFILGGPSEGGLVTALTLERHPNSFDGGLSICGPIGYFHKQIQYNGDFHVLFNYFFGTDLAVLGFNTGSPLGIGENIMEKWSQPPYALQEAVKFVLSQDVLHNGGNKMKQLLKCASVTVDINDPEAMGLVILQCLRYNIMITDNMIQEHLNGIVPFYNKYKWYRGSDNDRKLNQEVQRIYADSYYVGRKAVEKYETSARIKVPFVTIHTTGDHVTPFWHNPLYRMKALLSGTSLLHFGIPVNNYGHCTIEESHVVAGLAIIMVKIGQLNMFEVNQSVFSSKENIKDFKTIMHENSVEFKITE